MTPQGMLENLISHGAVIKVFPVGIDVPELTLAEVLWYTNPSRIRWCAVFPQHQGHVHETEYDKVRIVHDRDIGFYKDGGLVAYVCPYEESGLPDEDVRDVLAKWSVLVGHPWNKGRLKEFIEMAM